MSRSLPENPNLEHLRKQAKDLLARFERADAPAVELFRSFAGSATRENVKLADAQHVIAREYGFANWAKLKHHVESLSRPLDPGEALGAAIRASDAGHVALLLDRHPELAQKINDPLPNSGFGETPLFAAVQRTDRKTIEVLLRAGADINARTRWWAGGFGVLDDCAHELAPFLIERGAKVDAHAAARLGMLDKLKDLIAADPDVVHARGGDGQTPLHFASTIEIAQYLLDRGADMNARDIDHESTAAQYMVRVTQKRHYPRDRQDIARLLVARGCRTDILMTAALGETDLVHTHLDRDPDCVRTSVSEEYFPKQNPRSGGTVYIWVFGHHRTAHQVARDFGHEDIYRLLMERSPEEVKLAQACEQGDAAMTDALLQRRPGLVSGLNEAERRKLAHAAHNNNMDAVRLMLRAGWPVDVRGAHGATPLHFAAWHGNAGMVRELLSHGAPVNPKSADYGATPLGWALHGSVNSWQRETGDYGATIEALLAAGAEAPEVTDELEASDAARDALRRREQSKLDRS